MTCPECQYRIASCDDCSKTYSITGRKFTNINAHVKTHVDSRRVPDLQLRTRDEPLVDDDQSLDEYHDCDDNIESYNDDHNDDISHESAQAAEVLIIDFDESNQSHSETFSMSNLTIRNVVYPNFGNQISNTYFEQDYKMFHEWDEMFGGIRGVSWRSRNRLRLYDTDNLSGLDDTKFMFNMTRLISTNTKSTNEDLYEVLSDITDRMDGHFGDANPDISVPTSDRDAQRNFLHGQFGIFNNLPCPTTHNIGDGHACMRIGDIIAHHFGLGRTVQFTESPTDDGSILRVRNGIHGCQAMNELLDSMKAFPSTRSEIFYCWLTTWSDSFLRSYVKQKQNNVWMYTITLPDPDGNNTSHLHTYCVAVGAGFLDHTSVIDWYAREVEELMKGKDYYYAHQRKFIHVKFGVVAALADRPEKAFTLKTALLGHYGRIASWATGIEPDALADCKKCFGRRLEAVLNDRHSRSNIPNCGNCCQWDLRSQSLSRKRVLVPELYPTTCHPSSPEVPNGRPMRATFLEPIQQTFAWLITAVLLAAYNVSAGVWNKGVMDAYLQSCAISQSIRTNLWKRCKPGNTAQENQNDIAAEERDDVPTTDVGREVIDGYDPTDFFDTSNVVPAIWCSSLLMSAYVDCGMHLVFHGVLAYCVERICDFMVDHTVTPKFEKLVNHYLIDIQSLRLEWCKMKFFPKKQWLAENELGLSRVLPFVYGLFFMNIKLPERNTSSNTIAAIRQMVQSLHVLISILMSPRDPSPDEIDEHVKLFLSCCHRYSRSYYDENTLPFWANTGNFPTLLCLAEQCRRHGPIRWYWEGTSERFIQQLKKVLASMRKTHQYFAGKLKLMYRTSVMNELVDELRSEVAKIPHVPRQRVPRMYYQYSSLEDIERRVTQGEVLSGFSFKDDNDEILFAYGEQRRSGIMSCVSLTRVGVGESTKLIGLAYVKCVLEEQDELMIGVGVKTIENNMKHYCLLLPLIIDGDFAGKFAIVYDDWDVGDENFRKSLPNICKFCFANDVMAT